jgi:dienelactone hydrolase
VVLGLPRGGVPVAAEVASHLGLPLDVAIVRKLGVPFQPELAMGAIGEDGVRVINPGVIAQTHVSDRDLAEVEHRERIELLRRVRRFRSVRPREPLVGRTAIIVDDGFATGATASAACEVARAHGAARVVLAAPVGAPGTIARLGTVADEIVVVEAPPDFLAVGQFYDSFEQTSDDEVSELLSRSAAPVGIDVMVHVGDASLPGHLTIPDPVAAVVVFAHGSGSSRHSPRNRRVAHLLQHRGLATLLLDLLEPAEEHSRARVFDIDLLATRLSGTIAWVRRQPELLGLPVMLFGASTGSAAALMTAARHGSDVAAVVSRGGRPDLAADWLGQVRAPTLLIVGGADDAVLDLNRRAQEAMTCECRLVVVPGATHLFEEPGALDEVADLAREWFLQHVPARSPLG